DCDEFEESIEIGLEGMAWLRSLHQWRGAGAILSLLTAVALWRLGEWDRAEAIFVEVATKTAELTGLTERQLGAMSALLAGRQGRRDVAGPLEALVARWSALKWDASLIGVAHAARIEVALSEHRHDDARAIADRGIDLLEGTDDVRFRSRLIELAIRVESEIA